jgi:exopolyphosphatase/pppGpp-phosphohydrolase
MWHSHLPIRALTTTTPKLPTQVTARPATTNIQRPPVEFSQHQPTLLRFQARINDSYLYHPQTAFKDITMTPNLPVPVAAIDVGSNLIKVLILLPNKAALHEFKYLVSLGKSLKTGQGISKETEESLRLTWAMIQTELKNHQVNPNHVLAIATEGLRAAGPQGEALAHELGIEIISGKKEGQYVYQTLMPPGKTGLALAIGGGSTEIAFNDPDLNLMLPYGSSRHQPDKPFDINQINQLRKQLRKALKQQIPAYVQEVAQGQVIYINPLPEFSHLLTSKNQYQNPFQYAIQRETLDYFLSDDGLDDIQSHPSDRKQKLPGTLAILIEVMNKLRIQAFHFGRDGGMKTAVLLDKINQLARQYYPNQSSSAFNTENKAD